MERWRTAVLAALAAALPVLASGLHGWLHPALAAASGSVAAAAALSSKKTLPASNLKFSRARCRTRRYLSFSQTPIPSRTGTKPGSGDRRSRPARSAIEGTRPGPRRQTRQPVRKGTPTGLAAALKLTPAGRLSGGCVAARQACPRNGRPETARSRLHRPEISHNQSESHSLYSSERGPRRRTAEEGPWGSGES